MLLPWFGVAVAADIVVWVDVVVGQPASAESLVDLEAASLILSNRVSSLAGKGVATNRKE